MIAFMLPSNPMNKKEPDYGYEEEYNKLKENNFKVYLINVDDLENSKPFPIYENEKLIYRGWMLSEKNYELMNQKVNNNLITDTKNYLYSHHIIGWYEEIKENTFETYFATVENAKEIFKKTQWSKAFVKDYVKSIKTGKGSIVDSEEDIVRVQEDMLKYKGFIEGGIVFRKEEKFDKDSETRFFILNGKVFSPNEVDLEMLNLANEISKKHSAFFYSVDIIKQEDSYKVIEIGDGQVSDMVGWSIDNFVEIFKTLENKKQLKLR